MEDNFLSINIEYGFSSGIGRRQPMDCITGCKAVMYAEGSERLGKEYAGEIDFKIINLEQAEAEGFDIDEVFDSYACTERYGVDFYDFDSEIFNKFILNKFPNLEFYSKRICIIETIGIVPKFRGNGLGRKVFRNLVWHFDYCGLFVLHPYPLQFESPDNRSDLSLRLDLDSFEQDQRKATASLSKYYQSWGLEKIKGISSLLFYCTRYRNEIFDKIEMGDD